MRVITDYELWGLVAGVLLNNILLVYIIVTRKRC
jgi:hypothetical protein